VDEADKLRIVEKPKCLEEGGCLEQEFGESADVFLSTAVSSGNSGISGTQPYLLGLRYVCDSSISIQASALLFP